VDGTPSAHSIVRKWRAQRLEDEERILLQERVFSAEEHHKSRLAAGGVTTQEAESLERRINNARAELVSSTYSSNSSERM
jgi:hypothetical protein